MARVNELGHYRRNAREVDAILFDGSHESAAEISRRLGLVSYDGGRIEVSTVGGRVYAGMGCWVVRDRRTRTLSVVDDRDFGTQFERIDEPRAALDRLSFARKPETRGWDVV